MTSAKEVPRGGVGDIPNPTSMQYFHALPDGWSSFPTCLASAAFLVGLRERGAVADDALPKQLRHVLHEYGGDEEWLPEVVHVAAMIAVRDACFGHGPEADAEFLEWTTQLNRELFSNPRYAAALSCASPRDLVPRLPAIWSTFHRGSTFSVTVDEANHATCLLEHPRLLFTRLSLESHRRALAVLLAKAGAAKLQVTTATEVTGDHCLTTIDATWG